MSSSPELDEIGTAIQNLEQLVGDLRDRYQQVQADEESRDRLQSQLTNQPSTSEPDQAADLKAEIAKLNAQLDEVEMRLESRLVSWLGLREYFWQIVRFGGLGLMVGWGLTTWVMNDRPNPENQPTLKIEQPQ